MPWFESTLPCSFELAIFCYMVYASCLGGVFWKFASILKSFGTVLTSSKSCSLHRSVAHDEKLGAKGQLARLEALEFFGSETVKKAIQAELVVINYKLEDAQNRADMRDESGAGVFFLGDWEWRLIMNPPQTELSFRQTKGMDAHVLRSSELRRR